jgi:hypothetical protein
MTKPSRDEGAKAIRTVPDVPAKPIAAPVEPMPIDDPVALVEWGKRNVQDG